MSLEEKAILLVKDAILRGDFEEGYLPSEYRLAERFGVSRTPIRASLRHLEREGLVRNNRRRGYEIVSLDSRTLREMFEVREAIECYAVLTADSSANTRLLNTLRGIFHFYETPPREMTEFDIDCLREADTRLHKAIGRSLENKYVNEILSRAEMRLAGVQLMAWAARDRTAASVGEHIAIIDALLADRQHEAASLLREHISFGRVTMLSQLGGTNMLTQFLFVARPFVTALLDECGDEETVASRIAEERSRY